MYRTIALVCLAFLALAPACARADRPLWEIGLGVGSLYFPDYRGSDETNVIPVPLPYVIYRGNVFHVNRKGAAAHLFDSPRLSLKLSVSGSLPVDSSGNDARRGMHDIDPTLGAGPALRVILTDPSERHRQVYVELPAQAIFAVNFFHVHDKGFLFDPAVGYHQDIRSGSNFWNFGAKLGPLFATERYHRYFYNVAPRFSRPGRRPYDAPGGYSGARASGGVFFNRGRLGVGVFARYDYLGGAAFHNSPLVKRDYALIVGTALVWRLWTSEISVPAR